MFLKVEKKQRSQGRKERKKEGIDLWLHNRKSQHQTSHSETYVPSGWWRHFVPLWRWLHFSKNKPSFILLKTPHASCSPFAAPKERFLIKPIEIKEKNRVCARSNIYFNSKWILTIHHNFFNLTLTNKSPGKPAFCDKVHKAWSHRNHWELEREIRPQTVRDITTKKSFPVLI